MDIYDEMNMRSLKRTFYQSKDGSCAGRKAREREEVKRKNQAVESGQQDVAGDDSFILPFDVCVGPFGPPRPWGKFTHLDDDGQERDDRADEEQNNDVFPAAE